MKNQDSRCQEGPKMQDVETLKFGLIDYLSRYEEILLLVENAFLDNLST